MVWFQSRNKSNLDFLIFSSRENFPSKSQAQMLVENFHNFPILQQEIDRNRYFLFLPEICEARKSKKINSSDFFRISNLILIFQNRKNV